MRSRSGEGRQAIRPDSCPRGDAAGGPGDAIHWQSGVQSPHCATLTLLRSLACLGLAFGLCACRTTSVERTWKAPVPGGGRFQKIALLAVDERGIIRQSFEGQFATQLEQRGQAALKTQDLLSLPALKENREAAADRLQEAGADALLIVRLVDTKTRAYAVRDRDSAFVPVATGMDSYHGWFDDYTVAFMDMSVIHNSLTREVFLDSTLFDLKSGRATWSGLTRTVVKEETDLLPVFRRLVGQVVTAMRKDGVVP